MIVNGTQLGGHALDLMTLKERLRQICFLSEALL